MILYHFTAKESIAPIVREGLNRGKVPLSLMPGDDATGLVSLTTEASGAGNTLVRRDDCPRPLTAEERANVILDTGVEPPADAVMGDWTGSRITVKIPSSDRRLVRWSKFARKL